MSFLFTLLLCALAVLATAQNAVNGPETQTRRPRLGLFPNPFLQVSNIIADGMRSQAEIFRQGMQAQSTYFNQQVPAIIGNTITGVTNTVLHAAEYPATAAAGILLTGLNSYIIAKRKESVELPVLNTSLMGFGTFRATGGRLSKLSTLTLDGKVTLRKTGLTLEIDVPAKLRELEVVYDSYTFSTWGINLKGSIKADVKTNNLLMKLQMLGSKDCTINLQRIELLKLEDINIDVNGANQGYLSSIVSYIANFLKDTIKAEVQKALDDQLKSFLNSNSKLICSRFAQLNVM